MRRIHINKFVRFSSDKQLAEQLVANVGKGFVLVIKGQKYTAHDIEAFFQQRADVTAVTDTKKADYQAALQAEHALLLETASLAATFRQQLVVQFGDKQDVLANLGLALPKKRGKLTVEEKAAKIAKAEATRKGHSAPATAAPSPAPANPAPSPAAAAAATPPTPITPVVTANGVNGGH